MRKQKFITFAAVMLTAMFLLDHSPSVYAADKSITVNGAVYEFDKNSRYEVSTTAANPDAVPLGVFSLSGDVEADGDIGGFASYDVGKGNVSLSYSFDKTILNVPKEKWHLIEDKSKEVDGIELGKNISHGALILQSSLDGKAWTEEVLMQDVFTDDTALATPFYTTRYIQQQNGCYFRLIVAYEMEIKAGKHKVLFVDVDDKEYKKVAEVYEFYLHDASSTGTGTSSADESPRKELGEKIKTNKDKGFTGQKEIDKGDPHYGWDIGTFVINGYTRETQEDGTPVFLKKVGDKVTLWFQLKQNIDCLNGNNALTIFEDYNGYDKDFEVPQTNFKRGTLIVRYTDPEGKKSEKPVIYTDFLAAAATTSADTKAVLFEEGDYEVSLDYEIKNDSRRIGPISIIPTYTDYKINFSFKVRNDNSMAYLFDAATSSELANHAITANGFRIDMAQSRYLNVAVQRSLLKVNGAGLLIEDVRSNYSAKDGETFTDEGIYTITVKTEYTDEPTEKTIYVGTDKYLAALSKYAESVDELNDLLMEGAVVLDDGTIQMPGEGALPEPTPEPMAEPSPSNLSASTDMTEGKDIVNVADSPISAAWPLMIFGIVAVVVAGFAICFIAVIRRKRTHLKVSSGDCAVSFDGYVIVDHKDGTLHVSDADEIDEEDDE